MAKRLILGLAILLASCGGGGGGSGSGGGGSVPPPIHLNSLIGYGLVNHYDDVIPEQFAQDLEVNGLNFTEIAWAPWHNKPDDPCGSSSADDRQAVLATASAMHAHGIEVLVEMANGNDCAQMHQPDSYITDEIHFLQANTPYVMVTLSEPWASPSKMGHWTNIVRSQWAGTFVVPDKGANHFTGTPYYNIPYDFLDVHFCNANEVLPAIMRHDAALLANTDCSPILNPGAALAASWAKAANDNHVNLMIYDFHGVVPDLNVIQSMGNALKE